jgi:glutamate-1-semialdehyde 2,1-aminomutase
VDGRAPGLRGDGARPRIEDVDGNVYVDFSLGDTAAMAGHPPPATVAAVARRLGELGGATLMLPTEDAAWVGEELARRFGVALWSFALTATDANRWALRLCRAVTRRPYVLVFSHCYHGSVDESFITLDGARPRSRPGNVGPAVDPTQTTRVCEFNDLAAVERLLADGQVACVLAEPALTNIGIVLPDPGFHDGLRTACDATGTLLIIDETHTISAGPGGCTAAWGLAPDVVTIGKAIAGGIPIGAYGLSPRLAARIDALEDADLIDVGGVGGTLAGDPLSLAAARATLGEVLTADAFETMMGLCDRFVAGVRGVLADRGVPWSIVQLGARAELCFAPDPPRSGGASAALYDTQLEDALHLFLLNRGVMITPFHNMALMSPATSAADVDRHTEVFAEAVAALA